MTSAVRDRPVLTAWAATTPVGDDAGDVAAALLAGRDGLTPTPDLPVERAGVVGLDLQGRLGRKGTRSLDRLTSLVMVTTGALLDAVPERDPDLGLVLGTTAGSTASITAFTRDTLTGARPYLVDPAAFPNTVLNSPAGHTAIRHRLTGPNTTVAGAELAGVHALRWADRAVRCGHARQLVVGAAEDLSPERAWGHRRLRGDDGARAAPVGEACALLLLEDAGSARAGGRPVLGRVTGRDRNLVGVHDGGRPIEQDAPTSPRQRVVIVDPTQRHQLHWRVLPAARWKRSERTLRRRSGFDKAIHGGSDEAGVNACLSAPQRSMTCCVLPE